MEKNDKNIIEDWLTEHGDLKVTEAVRKEAYWFDNLVYSTDNRFRKDKRILILYCSMVRLRRPLLHFKRLLKADH
jgi:hypothetical protein